MPTMPMNVAIRSALDVMLGARRRRRRVRRGRRLLRRRVPLHRGLQAKYGEHRVFDTPIAEGGIIGVAVGMGAYGLRPVAEIQFADYVYPGLDQLISEAARLRYRSGGEFTAPITVRMPCGGGIHGGQTHSQSPESLFTHVCGLKTVMPSTPYDAKGLLIAAIEDDDPVIFIEPKRLYNGPFDGHPDRPIVPWSAHPLGEVPDGHYRMPLGSAAVRRPGEDVTVLAYGTMVYVAEAAADETGVDAEIIDLRTLLPLDTDTIERSVQQDRPLCRDRPRSDAHQRIRRRAVGARAGACFYHLEAPIERVTGLGHAVPARPGVGLLPRPGPRRRGAPTRVDGRPDDGRRTIRCKLPDVGEGVAEAEIVEWHVAVGDTISEDDVHRRRDDRQGDRRAARHPSTASSAGSAPRSATSSPSAATSSIELAHRADGAADGAGRRTAEAARRRPHAPTRRAAVDQRRTDDTSPETATGRPARRSPPSTRRPAAPTTAAATGGAGACGVRAPSVSGIDLADVTGTGPEGRIVHADLDACSPTQPRPPPLDARPAPAGAGDDRSSDVKIDRTAPQHRRADAGVEAAHPPLHLRRGGRRHRALERLRHELNDTRARGPAEAHRCCRSSCAPSCSAVADHPEMNARFDDEAGVVDRHRGRPPRHRRPDRRGLMVPVVKHADGRDLWHVRRRGHPPGRRGPRRRRSRSRSYRLDDHDHEPRRARRHRVDPVINAPEVAIIGVNKIVDPTRLRRRRARPPRR